MKVMRRLFTALLALAALSACAMTDSNVVVAEGVRRDTPVDPPVAETVRGLTAFGHALFAETAAPGANTVLSPLSIGYAFGMARAGAAESTAAELDRIFGFPAQGPHTSFNALTRRIVTTDDPPPTDPDAERDAQDGPEPPVVAVAGGLFTQEGLRVEPGFLRTLAAQYGTGVRQVDFAGDAAEVIDAWAERQTAGRIKKVFDRLDAQTRLVLANTVYLKADWKTPFTGSSELNAVFTRADGTTVRTELMRREDVFPYAAGPGWQAVELRYAGDELAMWVLLPRPGGSPAALLAPEVMTQVATGLRERSVRLALPRWDFSTSLDLARSLGELGLTQTDYPGIVEGAALRQAVHRATVTVDEWGTEAAAVTGLAFTVTAPAPAETEVRADRPFAFAIVHRPTLTPLFIGQVADPTAKG
ncbi:serpin B [Streptosporangium becharense]|uniref:Serpin B n=1 Tax=Streptosporangium becharense TaxID=1816182 RepID=A0A7W9IL31_9ACTN|nr:serpin family protein [Streptosporangium becharense]MBB2913115.1 serpin B [Streptosporangium becharense]MBB5822098.1 serpin B [Streptosporangium becharense]